MREAKAVEAVWQERALRLSQRPVSAGPAQNAFPVLVLGVAKERYGIHLPDVAEVLPVMHPTPVPGAAAVFAGVINVHGEIRPVIDLRRFLGMQAAEEGHARVILLRKDGRELGLQIDSVEHIRWIGPGEFGPGELGPGELGPGELGPGELGPGELGPGELGPGELGPGELGPGELGPEDLDATGSLDPGCSQHVRGSTKDLLMLLGTEALFAELHTHTGVTT
ncbi:MAG: chemotaxis protein CheW [Bryobacteraceae bacterium]